MTILGHTHVTQVTLLGLSIVTSLRKKTIYKAEILKITERYITVREKLISGIEPFETTIRIDTIMEITKR